MTCSCMPHAACYVLWKTFSHIRPLFDYFFTYPISFWRLVRTSDLFSMTFSCCRYPFDDFFALDKTSFRNSGSSCFTCGISANPWASSEIGCAGMYSYVIILATFLPADSSLSTFLLSHLILQWFSRWTRWNRWTGWTRPFPGSLRFGGVNQVNARFTRTFLIYPDPPDSPSLSRFTQT